MMLIPLSVFKKSTCPDYPAVWNMPAFPYLFENLSSISTGNLPFWYLFSWSPTWLKVRLGYVRLGKVMLGYVMLFPAKINIIFGISTSNNGGISKIYAERQVALHSLTFTLYSLAFAQLKFTADNIPAATKMQILPAGHNYTSKLPAFIGLHYRPPSPLPAIYRQRWIAYHRLPSVMKNLGACW